MVLVTHIILAVVSIIHATYTAISPSKTKLHINYLLIFGTVASGTAMIIVSSQFLVRICITGVIYLGFMIVISIVAKKRLLTIG